MDVKSVDGWNALSVESLDDVSGGWDMFDLVPERRNNIFDLAPDRSPNIYDLRPPSLPSPWDLVGTPDAAPTDPGYGGASPQAAPPAYVPALPYGEDV